MKRASLDLFGQARWKVLIAEELADVLEPRRVGHAGVDPDRSELDPKPETVRVATPPLDEQPVSTIEEEEALQFAPRRSIGEAAVSRRLLIWIIQRWVSLSDDS